MHTTFSLNGTGVNRWARANSGESSSKRAVVRSASPYTLGIMARKRTAPGASGHDAGEDSEDRPDQDAEKHERFGPLAVERHVKDDGRALILYTDCEGGP
jgi:hypothetical protein